MRCQLTYHRPMAYFGARYVLRFGAGALVAPIETIEPNKPIEPSERIKSLEPIEQAN